MKRAIVGILACALAVAFGACAWMGVASRHGPSWGSARIVRLNAPGGLAAGNMSLGYMRWSTKPAEGNSGALLVRDGDLLAVQVQEKDAADKEETFILPWRSEDGEDLSLKRDGPCLALGDRVVSLDLNEEAAGWDWVGKASETELASLRFITVDKPLAGEQPSDEMLRAFEKIAGVNPHVGLSLHDGTLLARVPSLDPRWLWIDNEKLPQADLDALAKRKAIETLLISAGDADMKLQELAALPNLRRLTLNKFDSAKTALPDLPRLESLTFCDGALQDLTPLRPLTGLRDLNFTLAETASLNGIEALPQLEELGICGAKDKENEHTLNCAPLDGLKQLRWISFGPGITPGQIARVVQTHPDLQTVEVLKCEGMKSLAPLANLRDLKALIFMPAGYQGSLDALIGTLKQMKKLRLLVLSEELFKEEPAGVAELRGELPGCVIAEGAPLCLGAGRILLLLPLVAFGWIVIAGRRSRAA